MKRLALLVMILALPSLACNLSDSPTAVPTVAPAPVLQNPVLGLNPVSGAPGTVINVSAAGFPTGAKVNLFVAPVNPDNTTSATAPVAQNLTIGTGGILSFALSLPTQISTTTLTNNTNLMFTVATLDNTMRASAIFVAVVGNGLVTPTQSSDLSGGGSTGGANLFITSPAINSAVAGGSVVVTGSGAAYNNRVGVQVQDSGNNVLGSSNAVIQAGTGAVGPWEAAVGFTQPASATSGYIVVFTLNAQGGIVQQASIPIALGGQAAPTSAPAPATPIPATALPVITAGPTSSIITATP